MRIKKGRYPLKKTVTTVTVTLGQLIKLKTNAL